MSKLLARLAGVVTLAAMCASTSALAATIPVGYVSWDVNIPGSVGKFDIFNSTGVNSFAPDFPITTAVALTGLSLTVHFEDGSSAVYGPSYFTLGLDGLSWDGSDVPIGGANPLPTDATLTGSFATTSINATGFGAMTISPSFSVIILPSVGKTLADFDFALIEANASPSGGGGGSIPEPNTLLLVGLATALAVRRTALK